MPWYSPLFRVAGTAVLEAARREFSASTTGQLYGQVQREIRSASNSPDRLGKALDKYSRFGPSDALRELRGTQFGQFAREVERYARGDAGMKKLLDQFLNELGPAGRLIKALTGVGASAGTGAGSGSEIDKLIPVLQAFGYEVLSPPSARRRGDPVTERGLAAAAEMLRSMGVEVPAPPERPAGRLPFGVPAYGEDGQERGRIHLPMADGPARQFGVGHPIVTGEMIPAMRSSNVHSYGYDIETAYLYVRYLGYSRGNRGPDGRPLRSGPGSLYRYSNVTPEEFLSIMAASSKGDWVWDNLRIRGTWSGHQKDYELVGVEGGYVPRKATVRRDLGSGQLQEVFVQRRVKAIGGGWLISALPNEVAGELPWGEVDRGRPDRGSPDRGEPDRGR